MTLWPCPACGKPASMSSTTCPHCKSALAPRREGASRGGLEPAESRGRWPLVAIVAIVLAVGGYVLSQRGRTVYPPPPAVEPLDADGRPLIYFESLSMDRVRQVAPVERVLAEVLPNGVPLAPNTEPLSTDGFRTGTPSLDTIWASDDASARRNAARRGMKEAITAAGLTPLQYEVLSGRIALAAVKWSRDDRRHQAGLSSDTARITLYPTIDDDVRFFAQHRIEIGRIFPLVGIRP